MERLDLSARPEHPTQESTIHLARYASILPFVKDKVVLDIACGEGYGSALMMRAGARRVVGVDISAEAVEKSRRVFAASGAEYIQADATSLDDLFEPGMFDVVVSIETIEHVMDHEAYLSALKRVAKPEAVFLVSCPNDYWYYPNEDQANPYHLRKYRLEEFQAVSTKILGDNVHWALGSAVFGFGTAPLDGTSLEPLYSSWMKANELGAAFVVENDTLMPLATENSSYFMGLWNTSGFSHGAAYFGVSMDAYARMFDALAFDSVSDLKAALEHAATKERELTQSLELERQELRNKALLLAAVQSENKVVRENINGLWDEINRLNGVIGDMQVGYWRYRRISDKIPESLRRAVVKCVRILKR